MISEASKSKLCSPVCLHREGRASRRAEGDKVLHFVISFHPILNLMHLSYICEVKRDDTKLFALLIFPPVNI